MSDTQIPFLCGGIFFFLVSGIKQGVSAREHAQGMKDEIKNEDIMNDLVYAVTGMQYHPSKSEVSLYRSCGCNGTSGIPFDDKSVRDAFSDAVFHNYSAPHKRMTDFLDTYMGSEQHKVWFVKALLDIVLNDDSIPDDDCFYIQPGGLKKTKSEIREMREFNYQPFVLGIIHYIVSTRHGRNKEGKSTFDSWKIKVGNEYKYNGNAGTGITYKINVHDYRPSEESGNEQTEESVDVTDVPAEDARTDDAVIFDSLKGPIEMLAEALKAQKHQMAEQIRQNNKKSDSSEDEPETVEAEVVDGEESSGAAKISENAKVIHQTVVNQYGDNPIHIEYVENLKL